MLRAVIGSIFASDQPNHEEREFAGPGDEQVGSKVDRTKVLVVDDQTLIADTLAEILEGAGFEAVAAHDGWQALEIAERFRPDWLISDVLMPRMNGVELAIAMRQKFPRMAVILFSGQAGIAEILDEGEQRGYGFEVIAKPVHPLELIKRLKEA